MSMKEVMKQADSDVDKFMQIFKMLDSDSFQEPLRKRQLIKNLEKRFRKEQNPITAQSDHKMRELSIFFLKRIKEKAMQNRNLKQQFS